MKRNRMVIVLALSLLMVLCVPAAAAGDHGRFVVSHGSGEPGDTVTVTVSVENNPGLICTALTIHYDSDCLQLIKAEDACLLGNPVFSQTYEANPYRVSWNDALAADSTENGVLVTLTFQVLDDAVAGVSDVTLSYNAADVFNSDLQEQSFVAVDGGVTIHGRQPAVSAGKTPAETPSAVPPVAENVPVQSMQDFLNRFSDLPENAWYSEAVAFMLEKGYMNGVGDTYFSPDGEMTRAQLVTILHRAADAPRMGGDIFFADVLPDMWYSDAVRWAYFTGVTDGIGNGLFGTSQPITRQQLVTLLYRWSGDVSPASEHLSAFSDAADVSPYAREAMNWAVAKGILKGDGRRLLPDHTATRAQAAAVLWRCLKVINTIPVPETPNVLYGTGA